MSNKADPIAEFVLRYLRSDMVVLDIGANQGLYTKLFAQYAAHVYAFEPNHGIVEEYLKRNTMDLRNVTIIPKAVSNQRGWIDFHIDARPGMGAVASSVYLLDDLVSAGMIRTIQVEAITVDDFCEQYGIVPGLIKIDVEGHEPSVIEGAARIIEQYRPVLIFEFWETWWKRGVEELFDRLAPIYNLVRLQDGIDAYTYYKAHAGSGNVDIGAVPRHVHGFPWLTPKTGQPVSGARAMAWVRKIKRLLDFIGLKGGR